ncbi:uncharacterized protein V1516DRAFT_681937 [Lipomyces oligophaga]|uniref:uncharacterized protein n=1 Tax=Lipomyces oligophaga TaxID=45792 RepID=UPI0034CD3AA6
MLKTTIFNSCRFLTASRFSRRTYSDFMKTRPGPPRLSKQEQDEFDRLVKRANAPFASTSASGSGEVEEEFVEPEIEVTVDELALEEVEQVEQVAEAIGGTERSLKNDVKVVDRSFHPDYLGKTIPEFEGEVNPKTGEIGGPKQDPLRHGDYSFNGRVTDF